MKKTVLPAICILLCTLFITFIPTEAEAAIYDDTLRLHILAPSDSTEDQNLKLLIRDMVLDKYGALIRGCSDSDEAEMRLYEKIPEIKSDCEALVSDTGYDYSVDISIAREWYDTRDYRDFSLPCGKYASLKITLGEGEGQNWWCVMYPPMCLDVCVSEDENIGKETEKDKTEQSGEKYTKEEYKLIRDRGYRVKFKLLEVASLLIDS